MLRKRIELHKTCDLSSSVPKMVNQINKIINPNTNIPINAHIIAGYFPIKHELNILPILSHFNANLKYKIALPTINAKFQPLTFRLWSDLKENSLIQGKYKIPVPDPKVYQETMPDVLLVPLVAFTQNGLRLGYGGGYYDRTIRILKSLGMLKAVIGVAYEGQRCDYIPKDEYDQCMDAIITEKKLYMKGLEIWI